MSDSVVNVSLCMSSRWQQHIVTNDTAWLVVLKRSDLLSQSVANVDQSVPVFVLFKY